MQGASGRVKLLLLFGLLGAAVLLALLVTALSGMKGVEENVPLQDAVMTVKHELTLFHGSLDGYLHINKERARLDEAWGHLDRAEWYTRAMLEGGKGPEATYRPIHDPALQSELRGLLTNISDVRVIARERLKSEHDGLAEKEIEDALREANNQASLAEGALHRAFRANMRRYRLMSAFLTVSALLFIVAVGLVVFRYERQREGTRLFLQSIIDGVADPVMVIDLDHNVKLMNTAAKDISGEQKTPPGRQVKCHEIFHGSDTVCDFPGEVCPLGVIKETGQPVRVEHRHGSPEGEARALEIMAAPLRNPAGRLIGMVEAARDITERKLIERQKADFLAMVTHDLKSPLSAILGYSEMLLADGGAKLDPTAREMVKSIDRCGARLLGIVNDFLMLSRIEAGKLNVNLVPADINEALKEVVDEARVLAAEKGIVFSCDAADGLPKALMDGKLLQRAVANLLQNAVNYTPPHGSVSVKTSYDDGGGRIVITVSDTGLGIPPDEQGKIFERYYRSAKSAGIKGSGLGLAIVKAVADAHRGTVRIESAPGRGSVFTLAIPVKDA